MLALITGGSTGIGFELAREFASHGYDLAIVAHGDELFDACERLRSHGARVQALKFDLSSLDDVVKLANSVDGVDALVLNAGTAVYGDFIRHNSFDDEMRLLNLNVVGTVALAKLVIGKMILRGSGRVMITSSIAATMPGPLYATYAASKAFLLSFSEALRNELSDTRVSVTCLLPGPTETDIFSRTGMSRAVIGRSAKQSAADVARAAFRGMMKGDETVAPNLTVAFEAFAARFLPRSWLAAMHRQMTKPAF